MGHPHTEKLAFGYGLKTEDVALLRGEGVEKIAKTPNAFGLVDVGNRTAFNRTARKLMDAQVFLPVT
jgi:hypothetical protein